MTAHVHGRRNRAQAGWMFLRAAALTAAAALIGPGCSGSEHFIAADAPNDAGISGELTPVNDGGFAEPEEDSGAPLDDAGVQGEDAGVSADTDGGECPEGEHDNGLGTCVFGGCAPFYQVNDKNECTHISELFVDIPAGSFVISHNTSSYSCGETVTLNAFSMMKTPVTVEQFAKCAAVGACLPEHYYTFMDDFYCNYNRGGDWTHHPMNCLSWQGAREYCQWIGGRLPTSDEWEYASTHDGTQHLNTTYPWGDEAPVHCVTANYFDVPSDSYCAGRTETAAMSGTSEVGIYSPAGDSPLGLVDMGGNIFEWTSSLDDASVSSHIYKGGFWDDFEYNLPVTLRGDDYSADWVDAWGVRCVKQ